MTNDVVNKLVARFQLIDAERMRDLPIYNPALAVEAIDFQRIEIQPSMQAWIGTLITPWFMNVVLIDIDELPPNELGQRVSYKLPSGDHEFMVGEDEELGRYDFLTLASPVLKYKTQQSAQTAARTGLQKLLTALDQATDTPTEKIVHFDTTPPSARETNVTRRELLRGHFIKPGNS